MCNSTDKPQCCHDALRLHYVNTATFQYVYCDCCREVIYFRWKSFWRRLKAVFVNDSP